MSRIHPESPDHPQQLRMKRLISQIGESYWKYRVEPLKIHLTEYEDNVNTFDRMLKDMRRSKDGIYYR
jgi:hypothetical protein